MAVISLYRYGYCSAVECILILFTFAARVMGCVFKWTINLVSDVSGILETSWKADIQVIAM